jgi:hypothetical protein
MTSVTTPLDTRPLDPRHRERATAHLLVAMTLVQAALGGALLVAPAWVNRLLTGAVDTWPEKAVVLRVAGIGVLAIGAWCGLGRLSENGHRRSRPLDLVPGLVVYNGCVTAIVADALLRDLRAPLLWPALAIHSALLIWCLVCLTREHGTRR